MRTPVFELHILPMIRATDREHMVQYTGIDLWNYDQLVEHAAVVERRLGVSKDMPPDETGGPWPDEWVQLFSRWRTSGCKRLELGTAEYTFGETGTPPTVAVQATGTYPAAGFNGWLQIEAETHAEKIYVLYFEPPDPDAPVGGIAEPFDFVAEYDVIAGLPERRKIFIRDKEGLQQIHPLPLP
jgi:hypothetical protein